MHKKNDIELNLAPIIDCFTVLITYLLLSASFLSLSVLDITIPLDAVASSEPIQNTDVTFTIHLSAHGDLTTSVIEKGTETHDTFHAYKVQTDETLWDAALIKMKLQNIHKKYPDFVIP